MKKIIAASAISVLLSTSSMADDLTAKLQGRFKFEAASRSQSGLKGAEEKNITANKKNSATYTDAYVGARVEAESEGRKYGAQLALTTTTRGSGTPSYDRSHLFVECDKMGKVELGSNFGAASIMEVNALSYARASGDDPENYAMLDIKSGDTVVDTMPMFPTTYEKLDSKNKESARKITYYSPKYSGFQLGVSYTPDSANHGNLTVKDASEARGNLYSVGGSVYSDDLDVKDGWSGGLTYETQIKDSMGVKLAFTGETGTASKGRVVDGASYKMPKLKSYNVGAAVTSGPYTLVASYADQGKVGSKTVFGKDQKSKFYTFGGVYKQGPVGLSISYYKAKVHGNKMDTTVIGTDYDLAPGLQPFAEVAFFNGKGKLPSVYGDSTKRKFKGTIFLLGMKMAF